MNIYRDCFKGVRAKPVSALSPISSIQSRSDVMTDVPDIMKTSLQSESDWISAISHRLATAMHMSCQASPFLSPCVFKQEFTMKCSSFYLTNVNCVCIRQRHFKIWEKKCFTISFSKGYFLFKRQHGNLPFSFIYLFNA